MIKKTNIFSSCARFLTLIALVVTQIFISGAAVKSDMGYERNFAYTVTVQNVKNDSSAQNPIMTITGLNEKYFKGDVTNITVEVTDSLDPNPTYTLRVWFEDAVSTLHTTDDGNVKFTDKGRYKLVFTARNVFGGETVQTYEYEVKVEGFDYTVFIPVVAVLLMVSMLLGPVLFVVRKEFMLTKKRGN